jgi:hypothetical protein
MAERPTIQFEDVSLDEARRMGRGSRMAPELYGALKQKIQRATVDLLKQIT